MPIWQPLPADHDYCRFLTVDQITDVGNVIKQVKVNAYFSLTILLLEGHIKRLIKLFIQFECWGITGSQNCKWKLVTQFMSVPPWQEGQHHAQVKPCERNILPMDLA